MNLVLPADGPRESPNRSPLLRNRSFMLMWSSVAASGFGDRVIHLVALILLGANLDKIEGTSVNAGLTFVFFLPYLIIGLPAGWLADKLPRKWIMLTCDEVRACLLLLAFILVPKTGTAAISDQSEHWKVFMMVGAVGMLAATFNPSRNATIPQIVPRSQLQSANALIIGIATIASMIGLGVGGFMINPDEADSVRTGLWVGFLFYTVSGTFFAFLKIRQRSTAHAIEISQQRKRSSSAFAYIRSHRIATRIILMNVLVWAAAMVVYNAAFGLCKVQYGFASNTVIQHYTIMAMTIGLGMLSGACSVAWMNCRRESSGLAMVALLVTGVFVAVLAFSKSYALGLVLAFGLGFCGNTAIICFLTLLQSISPNFIRGRIMGANTFATTTCTVAINLIIWRMPNSDSVTINALKGLSVVIVVVAIWGLWLESARGPMSTRLTNLIWCAARIFVFVWHRLQWVGRHNMPSSGSVILATNHTTALDPVLIQATLQRPVRWVMLTQFKFWWAAPLWRSVEPIAMDQEEAMPSENSKTIGLSSNLRQMRQIISTLKDGDVVGLFPEGRLQRQHRKLQPFRPGVGMIARRSGAMIVPCWIQGTPQTQNMIWHFLKPSYSTIAFGTAYKPKPEMSEKQIVNDLRARLIDLSNLVSHQNDASADDLKGEPRITTP